MGAALLAKLGFCGWTGPGFGKCADWGGLTSGLDMLKSTEIRGRGGRIKIAGAKILLVEAPILK